MTRFHLPSTSSHHRLDMPCCDHCTDAESFFGGRAARRDLRRYRRKGPNPATQHLLRMLADEGGAGGTLLDIGGGVGAIQHELLEAGLVNTAVQVDASRPYLDASRAEAQRRGHRDRVEYHYGDFVEMAESIQEADIVTLDRVVCCYPDMPRLVASSTSRARELYGLIFPRPRVATGIFMGAANLFFRVRRSAFRTYVHPPEQIATEIERGGFHRVGTAQTLIWQVALYRRR